MSRVAVVLAACAVLVAAPASAVPPAPLPTPGYLAEQIDGYPLEGAYQGWRFWVEAQKGLLTEAMLAEPETLDGEQAVGAPLLRFKRISYDFGHDLTGEIRAYCRPAQPYGFDRASCHYRLRRADVPMAAGNWGAPNPVTQWLYDNFDPPVVVAQLRAAGITPDTPEWWRTDMTVVYEALPSPRPILRAHARMVTVDSRDCPAMAQALAALDRKALDWRLDMPTLGVDSERQVAFHDVHTVYTLNLLLPGLHGSATMEASGPQIEALVGPVLAAAAACEKSPA